MPSTRALRRPFVLSLLLVACSALLWRREIINLYRFATLFSAASIVENFRTMPDHWPARVVRRSGAVFEFPTAPADLARTLAYHGAERDMDEFLARRATTGLLVISHDRITTERYFLGNTPQTRSISWSVCKSFVSALVGIAIREGKIRRLRERFRNAGGVSRDRAKLVRRRAVACASEPARRTTRACWPRCVLTPPLAREISLSRPRDRPAPAGLSACSEQQYSAMSDKLIMLPCQRKGPGRASPGSGRGRRLTRRPFR